MRILLLTTNYPPVPGGVSRYLKGLVDCAAGEIGVAGIDAGPRVPHSRFKALDRLLQVLWSYRLAKKTESHVKILAGQPHLALGVWASGRSYSLTLHGGEWEDHKYAKRILHKLMNDSTRILTSSGATAHEWVSMTNRFKTLSLTPGLPSFGEKLLVNSFDTVKKIDPHSSFNVVAVARASPRKGIQKLVDAIQINRERGFNVTLTVIGQDQGIIKVNDSTGGVKFLGHVSDDELVSQYAYAQTFALVPERVSGGEGWEGFGIVYLEAAAAGLPIIATDTGGIREAITPAGSILLKSSCTVSEVAQSMEALILDASLRKKMSEANRAWARSNKWAAKHVQVRSLIDAITSN